MAISGCINGLVVTAFVSLLVLPTEYFVSELWKEAAPEPRPLPRPIPENVVGTWLLLDFPPLDLFILVFLLFLVTITYLCDWIQRKLMERRILKLKRYLGECAERLQAWDARREQLEATLRMVQAATSEYNLLLFLLLRRPTRKAAARCLFDKQPDECASPALGYERVAV